jgi:arginase
MFSEKIAIVSIPEWRGAGRRGTETAPKAFERFGLEKKLQAKGVKIAVSWYQINSPVSQHECTGEKDVKYETEIADSLQHSFLLLRQLIAKGITPVVLGGDHTVSIASVAAQLAYAGNNASKVGLIWIDAHGDVHTPDSSPSGHIHGMPLAILLGHGSKKFLRIGEEFFMKMDPCDVIHIGGNNLEDEEVEFFAKQRIPFFPKNELDTDAGFARAFDAITDLGKSVNRVVVSIDMDAFDKTIAPGVHARNKNGITRERAIALFDHIKSHCHVAGIDIAEIVPRKDRAHKTVELAYDFLLRLLLP